jgi:hypothetical protein
MAIAPIDSKVTVEVGGETITLRLNFRALALAKKAGVNLLAGEEMDPLDIAVTVRCLAADEHPNMTDEEAFALVVTGGEAVGKALADLFAEFAKAAEGNAKPKVKRPS